MSVAKRYPVCVLADKQQELDLPTVTVEQVEPAKERPVTDKNRPMSQISGVRKLKHTNSFAGVVPKYGVETPHMEELAKVQEEAGCLFRWEKGNQQEKRVWVGEG